MINIVKTVSELKKKQNRRIKSFNWYNLSPLTHSLYFFDSIVDLTFSLGQQWIRGDKSVNQFEKPKKACLSQTGGLYDHDFTTRDFFQTQYNCGSCFFSLRLIPYCFLYLFWIWKKMRFGSIATVKHGVCVKMIKIESSLRNTTITYLLCMINQL